MFLEPSDLKPLSKTCGFVIPKKLLPGFFLLGKKDEGKVVSFLYCSQEDSSLYIHYGFTVKEQRRKGYSMELRRLLIAYANQEDSVQQIVSTPFEGAFSKPLLKKLGFCEQGEQMVWKKI